MGCSFTACFHTCKKHKKKILKPTSHNNKINSISPKALQNLLLTEENGEASVSNNATELEAQPPEVANPTKIIAESKIKEEEQLSGSSRKKVTFDQNVSTYDEGFGNKESANSSDNVKEKEVEKAEEDEGKAVSDSSSVSSYITYPPNHRYHCCRNSDDQFEVIDLDDNDVEDSANTNGNAMIQEESSESLFSLSIDSRKENPAPEMGDKEVNSPLKPIERFNFSARNRSQCVLNPIENLSQWKEAKAITTTPSLLKHDEEKENVDLINCVDEQQPSLKQLTKQTNYKLKRGQENQIAVDTSLSSWLVEDTPNSKNSTGSVGNSPSERTKSPIGPILVGALMNKDLCKSLPSSLSHSSDDNKFVTGTVGSYWRHIGQATDSDSTSSSCRGILSVNSGLQDSGNRHSTPFQARLERELDGGLAQV